VASGPARGAASISAAVCLCWLGGRYCFLYYSWFRDASEKAYCAVVYLVLEASSGYHPVLLSSKTRVAPLSKHSIPRLELLSGVILARLVSSVKETLEPKI